MVRKGNGDINKLRSFMQVGSTRYVFGDSKQNKIMFRKWFNILQVLVRQFETGNCPIDSKAQRFPALSSVRGAMAALGGVFRVKDCSGGEIM